MARSINMLSVTKANAVKRRGFYCDGGGLYLQVAPGGSKSWVFRFKREGKARDMGLGPLHTITLSEAREAATECRRQLLKGIDPLEARRAEKAARELEAAKAMTFYQCATAYIADNAVGWRNAKHRQQWESTFNETRRGKLVFPAHTRTINGLPIAAIDTALVLKVLKPIWTETPETAARVRGRIETVLNWAKARGFREGENPARWKGHLDHLLPRRSKVRAQEHHPALPFADLPGFMGELRTRDSLSARALEFTILCAARTGETIEAEWSEFDLREKVWTVPGKRMKAGRDHRVPLSERALAILKGLPKRGKFVFAGASAAKPLSNMAMLELLRGMRPGLTVHGFRSTFKDWARERTNFSNEVSEAALAHISGDKVERAYARGDLFQKRRRLMEAWAGFCASPEAAVAVLSINQRVA